MADSLPRLKPMRWLAHLPLAVLPFLAAAAIEGPRLPGALQGAAQAALAAGGNHWASVTADGRDLEIRGTAPNRATVDRAVAAVAAIWGVRRVAAHVATQGLP